MTGARCLTGARFLTGACCLTGVLVVSPPAFAGRPSYHKLFQVKPLEQVAREQRRVEADARQRRGIVNGMPSIPLDASVDPKIFVQPRPPR